MSIYDYEVSTLRGQEESLSKYRGKVLLVVNTASKCGFTPQYKGLQEVYDKFKDRGFEVLGFPSNQFAGQEPGESEDIAEFCEINYGVTFPMYEKIDVKGDSAHPLFKYLSKEAPGVLGSKSVKWNFTKFLVDQDGRVLKRFAPSTTPDQIEADIAKLLD
ncbi:MULTISPECIES: glutathione peroxidase [unclassified Paenibacillus]|uniref:glutathione peroxidase n=1 Tax=unclassified Paenibacillus TaxID=185978 RepID=UPI002404A05B|nr:MULTISPECIES: glutathione peroxidase [unclassified Paenibacillus]MDF9842032.1 glutathione peroxidase [Paenibacillus sp. PastF-2]MDF9848714.1 glutathione peroxidase [Paenibacillus sp. PastM-2]MDF9855284.1 glutathione peroxidase [Paenibacillus sp. PastF-1]MDH6480554.1 glutathione peroxidase [Paenibacillus sp. PastH-2]MDH6507980.1 glutathione peroxidase [Paenibacillus sp. PastM-3]